MSLKSVCALVAAFAAGALAHGTVPNIKVDGTNVGGFLLDYYYMQQSGITPPKVPGWYAENLDIGFVEPNKYGTADIICHKNAKPGQTTTKVKAGGTVDFLWTDWPHGYGPVLTYVAKCSGSCTTVDKTSLRWVKIDEAGINYSTQKWASQDLIDRNNTWTTKVPASLAPGQYVFRHEIIALHGASSANGAQNYPQCFNIEVTGSGTANPTGVAATSMYSATDPGILMNPYTTITNYKIPGPALWSGAKSSREHARDLSM